MRFLVSAGPTREFVDPVRFLSNRSTGKMGYAVARAAVEAGHEVALVSGPVALERPAGLAEFVPVVSARDMLSALRSRVAEADVLVMTAAVADFRPARAARRKIHKGAMPDSIRLVPNPDILATLARRKGRRVFIGFAAETERAVAGAARKLRAKGLDLVVANDVTLPGAGFGTDTNIVSLVRPDGSAEALPVMPKLDVARRIVAEAESLFAGRRAGSERGVIPEGYRTSRRKGKSGRPSALR